MWWLGLTLWIWLRDIIFGHCKHQVDLFPPPSPKLPLPISTLRLPSATLDSRDMAGCPSCGPFFASAYLSPYGTHLQKCQPLTPATHRIATNTIVQVSISSMLVPTWQIRTPIIKLPTATLRLPPVHAKDERSQHSASDLTRPAA